MMSELNTGSKSVGCSQLNSTHTFILRLADSKKALIDSILQAPEGVSYQYASCQPAFNADRKYYTPSFLHRKDIAALSQQDQQYKDAFLMKTQEECLHTTCILQPKPSSTFCFVCKESFQDYCKHISHPIHKKFLGLSIGEEYMYELIESQQKKRKAPTCRSKQSQEHPRKFRKLETLGTASTLALQYFKESSTCVSIFQSQKVKS